MEVTSVGNSELVNVSKSAVFEKINYLSDIKYLSLDSENLERDVKSVSAFIDTVFIFKDLPNKITILIVEKVPTISLEIDNKKCVLLDETGFVLRVDEANCTEQLVQYKTILVTSDTPKVEFNVDSVSNYNQLFLITKSLKILYSIEIPVVRIEIKDNIAKFISTKNKTYTISFNQELEPQLARLMAVVSELEKKGYKFKSIDLRFKRPVLTIK